MATDSSQLEIPEGEISIYQGPAIPWGNAMVEPAVSLIASHLADGPSGTAATWRPGRACTWRHSSPEWDSATWAVGAVHALEYPIGGAVHCSHGCGNGLLLPYVMEFNKPGPGGGSGPPGRTHGASGLRACPQRPAADARPSSGVRALRKEIGIPDKLREIGVQEHQLRSFAEAAFGIKRLIAQQSPSGRGG